MTSEVRKVLDAYNFVEIPIGSGMPTWWQNIDAAERTDAEVRYTVECNRCGQHTCTSGEYPATCGCGTVFRLHRHNQQTDDAELRRKITELVARWSGRYVHLDAAVMVRNILAELNAIIATKPDNQSTSDPWRVTGVTPTKDGGSTVSFSYQKKSAPDSVTENRVREILCNVLDGLAENFGYRGLGENADIFRRHADKLRKECGT